MLNCIQSFNRKLFKAPILIYFDLSYSSNTCVNNIKVILFQYDSKKFNHLIIYYSQLILKKEHYYNISKKKCLVLLENIKHFRFYFWEK